MSKSKQLIASAVLIVILALSFLIVAPKASKPESYASTISYLNEKQKTVLALTGSVTGASVAVGLIPGDATTPIASKLMDMVGYFIIILCTVFLEKCLLSIAGYLTFRYLIPIACIAGIVFIWSRHPLFYRLAFKLAVFGIALFLVVPIAVKASQLIEKTNAATIDSAINGLDDITETAETAAASETESYSSETESAAAETEAAEDSASGIFTFIQRATDAVSDAVEDAKDKAEDVVEEVTTASDTLVENAKSVLNQVMNAVIVMLVTSCLIPVLVLYVIWSLVRQVLGIRLEVPDWVKVKMEEKRRRPEVED